MNDLSFHITDIVSNSIRAGASRINVEVDMEANGSMIAISVSDNGSGMDDETLERVRNPFYTTRKTRKIGLGIPFLIQNAEQAGGLVEISSAVGEGTVVKAIFDPNHIDMPPWGDLSGTVTLLICGNPDVDMQFSCTAASGRKYAVSTKELKEALNGLPLNLPRVTLLVKEMIRENLSALRL